MLELVLAGLVEHQPGALAHGVDAAQIAGRVEGRVGRLGQRDVGEARGPRAIGGGARGAQRAIGAVGLAAFGGDFWLGALAVEQAHVGGDERELAEEQCSRGARTARRGRPVEVAQKAIDWGLVAGVSERCGALPGDPWLRTAEVAAGGRRRGLAISEQVMCWMECALWTTMASQTVAHGPTAPRDSPLPGCQRVRRESEPPSLQSPARHNAAS